MTCPCEDEKKKWSVYTTPRRPKEPEWHIVVVSAGKSPLVIALLERLRTTAADKTANITLVDTSCPAGVWIKGCDVRDIYNAGYVGMPGEVNIPRAFNAGAARFRSSKYTLLLHDDITLPETDEWMEKFEEAFKVSPAVVVPHMTGFCSNPVQAAPEFGAISHSCEYISSAAIAMYTPELLSKGLNEHLSGYDWWQIEWQVKLASEGRATLVADATFDHKGTQTYAENIRAAFLYNLVQFNEWTGWPQDFKSRPRYPRASINRSDKETGKALCVSISSVDVIAELKTIMEGEEYSQLCVVDCGPNPDIKTALDKEIPIWKFLYAPLYDSDVVIQAINMSDYTNVEYRDMRPGADRERSTISGKRIRCGTHYDLPQRIEDIHIGMLTHYAVGDTMMMTPAIEAFKNRFPWINIHVHHGWDAAELLKYNPDIEDPIYRYPLDQFTPDARLVDYGIGNGGEEMIFAPFKELGLDKPDSVHLRYYVQNTEIDDAIKYLQGAGLDTDSDLHLVGVQRHGNYKCKQWAYTDELIDKLIADGKTVIEFGSEKERMGEEKPGVVRVFSVPMRMLGAIIHLLDAIVTFDSGLAFIAAALDVPIVSIWGVNTPDKLLGACGENIVCIVKRNPHRCFEERGTSCKHEGNSSVCPFREDGIGADCLDEITPQEVIDELAKMPICGVPINARRI
jgi:ADP-heptose:LPS heptosyltransferase